MVVVTGDARTLPVKSSTVQCVVTSPPYWNLRDYSETRAIGLEETLDAYLSEIVSVFREVARVLKDDGTVWLNLGDMFAGSNYRGGGASNATAKQASNAGSVDFMAKKPPPIPIGLKVKDLVGLPWRVAFALQADGWYLRSEIIWQKANPMPESIRDRPTKAHETIFLLTKNRRYYYDADAIKEPSVNAGAVISLGDKSFARRQADGRGSAYSGNAFADTYTVKEMRNRRSVWTFPLEPYKGAHFATFPKKLVEPCLLAGTSESDLVLDPFAGSGTVGVVAQRLRRRFVGVEVKHAYSLLASQRIRSNR